FPSVSLSSPMRLEFRVRPYVSCQATYDRPQHWFFYPVRRAGCRDPLDLTFPSFWPFLILTLHFQWEDVHFANDTRPCLTRFSYSNDPRGRLAVAPTTPASS